MKIMTQFWKLLFPRDMLVVKAGTSTVDSTPVAVASASGGNGCQEPTLPLGAGASSGEIPNDEVLSVSSEEKPIISLGSLFGSLFAGLFPPETTARANEEYQRALLENYARELRENYLRALKEAQAFDGWTRANREAQACNTYLCALRQAGIIPDTPTNIESRKLTDEELQYAKELCDAAPEDRPAIRDKFRLMEAAHDAQKPESEEGKKGEPKCWIN